MIAGLTIEMVALLEAGSKHPFNVCALPFQIKNARSACRELERLGYIHIGNQTATITEAGRTAIGAPTEDEARDLRLAESAASFAPSAVATGRQQKLNRGEYKRWKAMGMVCVLVVKLPDERYAPTTLKVARLGTNTPHYLGAKNAIVLADEVGFVLALIPKWLQERTLLPTFCEDLPEGGEWTSAQRARWKSLALRCRQTNRRIYDANKPVYFATRSQFA